MTRITRPLLLAAVLAGAVTAARDAAAIPSFARQTGWSCAKCHTVFPELTPLGRRFKLQGYITDEMAAPKPGAIEVSAAAPLSAMVLVDDTWQHRQPPATPGTATDATDNRGTARFPDQLSLFYGGPITSALGSFIQLTYSPDTGAVGMDQMDVRFARTVDLLGYDLTLGLDGNNTPTAQDAWNTGPAWGFPWTTSSQLVGPAASPVIKGLGPNAGSAGGYLFFNETVYAEVSAYRSAHQGGAVPPTLGAAPYWRVALAHEFGPLSVEVGGFGLQAKRYPAGAGPTGSTDDATDTAADLQAQYITDAHIVSLEASLIGEKSTPAASLALPVPGAANASNTLSQKKVNVNYWFNRMVGVSVGTIMLTGTTDAVLAPASPDSTGMLYEVDVLPWRNTKFAAQAATWSKLDGGTGKDASDRDAVALIAQLMF